MNILQGYGGLIQFYRSYGIFDARLRRTCRNYDLKLRRLPAIGRTALDCRANRTRASLNVTLSELSPDTELWTPLLLTPTC